MNVCVYEEQAHIHTIDHFNLTSIELGFNWSYQLNWFNWISLLKWCMKKEKKKATTIQWKKRRFIHLKIHTIEVMYEG